MKIRTRVAKGTAYVSQLLWLGLAVAGCKSSAPSASLKRAAIAAGSDDASPLGQAYDRDLHHLFNASCVKGEERLDGGETGDLAVERNLSLSQVAAKVSGDISAAATYHAVTLKPFASFALEHAANDLSDTVTLSLSGTSQVHAMRASSLALSDLGQATVKQRPTELKSQCGSEYIDQIHRGAVLLATIKVSYLDQDSKKLGSGGLQLDVLGGVFSVGGALSQLDQETKNSLAVSVRVDQIGGDPVGLASLLAKLPLNCSFNDIQSCFDTMAAVIAYAKGPFRTALLTPSSGGARPFWNIQSYVTKSYLEAGLTDLVAKAAPTPAVWPEAANAALAKLTSYFDQLGRSLGLAQDLRRRLGGLATSEVAAKVTQTESGLRLLLGYLPEAQSQCFARPEQCVTLVQEVDTQIRQLDLAALANLRLALSPFIPSSDALGGEGGLPIDDTTSLSLGNALTGLVVWTCDELGAVSQIDGLYANGGVLAHGSHSSSCVQHAVALPAGRPLHQVILTMGQVGPDLVVTGLGLDWADQQGQVRLGKLDGSSLVIPLPPGAQLAGFYGRVGTGIDKLGIIYKK